MADMYPFRESVYRLQEDLGGKISKHPLSYQTNLRIALDGAQDVVIVTHDYFKLAHIKNFYLEKAVRIAKDNGARKITWVAPMELDQLNPLDGEVESLIATAENKARELFPELSILKTNLIFGRNCLSLVLNKALEDLSARKGILSGNDGNTRFAPVFEEEVLRAFNALKPGEKVSIEGPEQLKYREIVNVLAEHCGASNPSHSSGRSLTFSFPQAAEIFYSSQVQQLERLLHKDREFNATVKGTVKLAEVFPPGKFQGVQTLHWHRVILD